jgi:hypothetical protein
LATIRSGAAVICIIELAIVLVGALNIALAAWLIFLS